LPAACTWFTQAYFSAEVRKVSAVRKYISSALITSPAMKRSPTSGVWLITPL
jgi:hypothetical protein